MSADIRDYTEKTDSTVDDNVVVESLPEDDMISRQGFEETEHVLVGVKRNKSFLFSAVFLAVCSVALVVFVLVSHNTKGNSQKFNDRLEEVQDFLFKSEVSLLPTLKDTRSSQYHASLFIADHDAYQMELPNENSRESVHRRFVERYVLALIYYQFKGREWTYELDWLSQKDHCEWFRKFTTTSGDKLRLGVLCDKDGYVYKLNLAYNNLYGNKIPAEVEQLDKLETLHMHFNHIGGYLPDSLQYMSNLKGIGLMKSGLTGPIPAWLGTMTQLTTLGLSDNKFHSSIPTELSNLKNLAILGLNDNNLLTGNIDFVHGLKSIKALYLGNNGLTGNLDGIENLKNLMEFDVSGNAIGGTLPAALLNHESIFVLDVNHNLLSGQFPDDIFENTQLRVLSAQHNIFNGTVPDRLGFVSGLKHLDLSYNHMTGTLPDTLTELTELHYWATSGNNFDPQEIMDLSKFDGLFDLSMKDNNLNGTIPTWIGKLEKLQMLDLHGNQLSGSIPSEIALLSGLDYLLLNRNKLTGKLPDEFGTMGDLDVLLLDGNSITGTAQAICKSNSVHLAYFVSNCYPGEAGKGPLFECLCCTQCCMEDDDMCNNKEWTANLDPEWKYGFVRSKYVFSLQNAPAIEQTEQEDDADEPIDPLDGK